MAECGCGLRVAVYGLQDPRGQQITDKLTEELD